MPHGNARLNEYARNLAVERYLSGHPVKDIAGQLGLSRNTVHKWIARYALEGPASWRADRAGRTAVRVRFRSLSRCSEAFRESCRPHVVSAAGRDAGLRR